MPRYPLAGRQPQKPFIPPTPIPRPVVGETRQRIMRAEEVRALINQIPGARATGFGEFVGFHIEAQGITEMIQKLQRIAIPEFKTQSKTMCDGEPVRIT